MSPETLSRDVPAAIRRATEQPGLSGPGWTVRINTPDGSREVRVGNQAQVARLALALERLGFLLQVDGTPEADFVFDLPELSPAS
ncbi:MAG: hypothetical protein NVS2B4_10720 [Ramlibacter sp.]